MDDALSWVVIGSASVLLALVLMLGLKLISPKRFAQIFAGLASGVAIGLALKGFGAWSLVGQTLTLFTVRTIVSIAVAPVVPRLFVSLRGLKDHAERVNQGKRAAPVTSEDVMVGAGCMLSVFVREPEFQGQTKDRLATAEAQKIVENAIQLELTGATDAG